MKKTCTCAYRAANNCEYCKGKAEADTRRLDWLAANGCLGIGVNPDNVREAIDKAIEQEGG